MLECANFLLEGYFRALYVPLGRSETWMESSIAKTTPSKSMKFYISMFNDKPPCMPLCFGIIEGTVIILPKAVGAFSFFISSFLAFVVGTFSFSISSFLASFSTFSSFLAFFFQFLLFLRLFLPLFFFLRLSFPP